MLFYFLSSKHRLITLHNLRCAFPEKKENEIIKIAKGVYRNLSIMMAEYFDLPYLTPSTIKKTVTLEGKEHYEEALKRCKGIIALCSHFGNWELQPPAGAIYLKPLEIVYRPLDNKTLEDIIVSVRVTHGNRMIPKGSAGKTIRELLDENRFVAVLADQNVDVNNGIFVDFFSRPACTSVGVAALAMQTGASVLPVFMIRQNDGKYKLILKPLVQIDTTDNYENNLFTNTQRFAKIAEEVIREYPEQWFWLHQRWKTKQCQAKPNIKK